MKKKVSIFLLGVILLLAAFFRLYKINDYMTFLGDEGRDVIVAKGILEGHFTFLGPRSSAGDFYMGPTYYYMMAPALWLSQLDPVGPAVMVALFGVATVYLIYFVGKKFFDERAGLFAAALYAVSPLVITYSHSSWNPDVLPFFSLLLIYTLYRAIGLARPWKYFLFVGMLLGISLQLHYLSLFLGIIIIVYTFFAEWYMNEKIQLGETFKHYLQIFAGFIIGFSPFLAFEVRHGFPNTRAIFGFIFVDDLHKGTQTHMPFFSTAASVFFRIFARLLFAFPPPDQYKQFPLLTLQLWGLLIIIVTIAAIISLFYVKNKFITMLLGLWLFLSVGLFGFYKEQIYDYHFTVIFTLPFLLFGNFFSKISQFPKNKKKQFLGIFLSLILYFALFLFNLYKQPFQAQANRQKDQAREISQFVLSKTGNKPFNFALLSKGNSDYEYRYYFEIFNHKAEMIDNTLSDPQRKTVADQLLVVCEDLQCQPLGNPLFDVASFGRAEIVGMWNVSVVKVYRLVHYKAH